MNSFGIIKKSMALSTEWGTNPYREPTTSIETEILTFLYSFAMMRCLLKSYCHLKICRFRKSEGFAEDFLWEIWIQYKFCKLFQTVFFRAFDLFWTANLSRESVSHWICKAGNWFPAETEHQSKTCKISRFLTNPVVVKFWQNCKITGCNFSRGIAA